MIKVLIALVFSGFAVQAQKYGTALGVRFGNNHYGVTAKQKLFDKTSLEGIVVAYPMEYNGTILLQQHFPLLGKSFNLYAGGGVHLGEHSETGGFYGYDGVLGAELKLPAMPILISADIKPAYHIGHPDWFTFSTAISAHIIISKDTKAKRQKDRERRKRKKEREKKRDERHEERSENRGERKPFDFLRK